MNGGDSGSSLVEAIVGISLMGTVLLGLFDASWTNTRVAAQNRARALASFALEGAEQAVESAEYSPCPHVSNEYLEAIRLNTSNDNDGIDLDITRYEYWQNATSSWVDFGGLASEQCSALDDLTDPYAIQRLTVTATNDRGSTWSSTISKSREEL